MHSKIMPISFIVVYPGPFLISPWKPLILSVAVVIFESSERARVSVFAFGLVTLEDGGGCTALKSSGGACCE